MNLPIGLRAGANALLEARFVQGFMQRRIGDVRRQYRGSIERLFITQAVAMEMSPRHKLPYSP
jgi:hypothetical protein